MARSPQDEAFRIAEEILLIFRENKSFSVTNLLSQCAIIAELLESDEILWIKNELEGYPDDDVPPYRKIEAQCQYIWKGDLPPRVTFIKEDKEQFFNTWKENIIIRAPSVRLEQWTKKGHSIELRRGKKIGISVMEIAVLSSEQCWEILHHISEKIREFVTQHYRTLLKTSTRTLARVSLDNEDTGLRNLRVFLSYSNKDKILAGKIKEKLEYYELEVFLAHEDIEPSIEWQEEIIRNLKGCDIFIPIISENFMESKWTDQESGIAFAEDKFIIPISVDLTPYGFIGKYQALKLGENISDSCNKIIEAIMKSPFNEELTDCLISSFINSGGFVEANTKADRLKKIESFTDVQINEIIRGFITNDQIRGAWTAERFVKELFQNYSDVIESELKEKFKWLISISG